MKKLSCGVVIFSLGLMGAAHATVNETAITPLKNVGGVYNGGADQGDSNINVERQNATNAEFKRAINDNSAAIATINTNSEAVKASADAAAKSAAQAAATVTAANTAANNAVTAANTAAGNAAEAIAAAKKVGDDYLQATDDMAKAKSQSDTAISNSKSAVATANAATAEVLSYEGKINDRVNLFEQSTNATVDKIHNEVGEVKASIQGAIQDSASALIKATHAEDVAADANMTAKRVEQGLAQEVVDRKADVERGIQSANDYTDRKVAQFEEKLAETKKMAAAGAASALAASQIPQVSQGSAFSLGVGMGNYSGESALALGMSARMGDYTVTKIALTTDTTTNVGGGIGIAVEW